MYGKNVAVEVRGLGIFSVFVWCVPSTTNVELQARAKAYLQECIAKGEVGGLECSFQPEK